MKEQDLKGNDVFLNCNSIPDHHSDNDSNDPEPGKDGEEDRERGNTAWLVLWYIIETRNISLSNYNWSLIALKESTCWFWVLTDCQNSISEAFWDDEKSMENGVIDIEVLKLEASLWQFIDCNCQVSFYLCHVGDGQLKSRVRLRKDGNEWEGILFFGLSWSSKRSAWIGFLNFWDLIFGFQLTWRNERSWKWWIFSGIANVDWDFLCRIVFCWGIHCNFNRNNWFWIVTCWYFDNIFLLFVLNQWFHKHFSYSKGNATLSDELQLDIKLIWNLDDAGRDDSDGADFIVFEMSARIRCSIGQIFVSKRECLDFIDFDAYFFSGFCIPLWRIIVELEAYLNLIIKMPISIFQWRKDDWSSKWAHDQSIHSALRFFCWNLDLLGFVIFRKRANSWDKFGSSNTSCAYFFRSAACTKSWTLFTPNGSLSIFHQVRPIIAVWTSLRLCIKLWEGTTSFNDLHIRYSPSASIEETREHKSQWISY